MYIIRKKLDEALDNVNCNKYVERIKNGEDFDNVVYELVKVTAIELEVEEDWNKDYYDFLYNVIESKISRELKGGN